MRIYKDRKKISITVLASIILILLLSWNFHIWSGNYAGGDLESIVIQQMDSIHEGKLEKTAGEEFAEQYGHLFDYAYLAGMIINACLWYSILFRISSDCFSHRPKITLCSLSVRMDN